MRGEHLDLALSFPHADKLKRRGKGAQVIAPGSGHLLSILRDVRKQLADAQDVPAYVIASNRALEEMAHLRPTTGKALRTIHGIGETKAKRYGQPFIDAIRAYNEG